MKEQVLRIDKFIVPDESKAEFLEQVHITHELLRTLPGFVEDFIVEKLNGPAVFNIVTTVVWKDHSAIANAKDRVHASQKERNFDPHELWSRLNIQADLGNYKRIEV